MALLVVYGSLINKEQLDKSSYLFNDARPVYVEGYRRVFNQEPSWRQGTGKQRAVLNVIKSDRDRFNALLVSLRDDRVFQAIDQREAGYSRKRLAQSQLTDFAAAPQLIPHGSVHIYVGRPEKQNDEILPNRSYIELCLRGAKQWGEEFYRQFLKTTYVGELTLEAFLTRAVLRNQVTANTIVQ